MTGRAAKRRAALIRGAMLEDLATGYRRVAYAIAHESGKALQEAMMIAGPIVKLGDHIAAHLDNKPSGQTRSTAFVFSGQAPNEAVPPDQAQRHQLGPTDPYETIELDKVPDA